MSLFAKVLGFVSLAFILSSCDSDTKVTGLLNMAQNTSMMAEKGDVVVAYELKAGAYDATALLKDKGRTLYLTVNDQDKKPVFKFDLPRRFPTENGEFSATPKELHQTVGLHGIVKSDYAQSDSREDWQSCQVQDQQTVCTPQGCFPQTVWRNGQQRIRYHIMTTLTHISVDILSSENAVVGNFKTDVRSSERQIEYTSPCF